MVVMDREGEVVMEVVIEVVAVEREGELVMKVEIPAVDGGVVTARPVVEAVVEVAAASQVGCEHNVHVVGLTLVN